MTWMVAHFIFGLQRDTTVKSFHAEGDIGGYPIPQYRKKKCQIPKYPVENRLNTDTAYLWVLPSSAFNYLRHLCTRCPYFFKYFGSFANFHWKEPFGRSTRQLTNSDKNNSWKRENKQTNQPKPFPRTSSASLDESLVLYVSISGVNYLDCQTSRAGKRQTYQIFFFNFIRRFSIPETQHLNLLLLR